MDTCQLTLFPSIFPIPTYTAYREQIDQVNHDVVSWVGGCAFLK